MFSNYTACTQNYQTLPFVEKINTPYVSCNGTYINPDKYYNFVIVNNNISEKENIYNLYAECSNFGKSELKAEENIINKNSIPLKENFMDYYE